MSHAVNQIVNTQRGPAKITKVWNSKPVCYTVVYEDGHETILPESKAGLCPAKCPKR